MRRNVFLGTLIVVMLSLSLALCGSSSPSENLSAEETNFVEFVVDAPNTLNYLESVYSLRAVKDILDHEEEGGNVELLYNANDEAEYILTTADEGGYAIFHRMTGSLMEAGEFGTSPYEGQIGKKYYFGPSNYAVETANGAKTDIMRGGEMTESQLTAMHRNMAEIRSLVVERSEKKSYSSMLSSLQTANQAEQNAGANSRNVVEGDSWLNNPYKGHVNVDAFTEIEHSDFYESLTEFSQFGHNTHGSCKFVSTVLLLRYYDMFVAPSLIPNESIPEAWEDVCDSAWNVLGKNQYGDLEYYDCSITESDGVYEALHKYLIAEETKTGFSIFGTHGYSVTRYNNGLPSCINVDNTTTVALTDNAAFNQVKGLIDTNNPVAIHISYTYSNSTSIGYHVVVAYGYLETASGKYYKAHFGWGASTAATIVPHYFVNLETNYLTVTDNHTTATAHTCTNYGVVSDQNVACFGNEGHQIISVDNGLGHRCACGLNEVHSGCGVIDAWQNYTQAGDSMNADAYREFLYESALCYNKNTHFVACKECLEYYLGTTITEMSTDWLEQYYLIDDFLDNNSNWKKIIAPHVVGSTVAVNGQCMVACQDCGYYMYSTDHTWGATSHSDAQCAITCAICGYVRSVTQPSYTYTRYNLVKHLKTCSNCGVSIEENHQNGHGTLVCLICGFGIGGNLSQRAR